MPRKQPAYSAWAFVVLAIHAGCSTAPPPASQPSPAMPSQVVRQLIEAREARRYADMPPLIVPGRSHEVTTLLAAVDDFVDANGTLCDYVRTEILAGLADGLDQSALVAELEVFSRHVSLTDEVINGDRAVVSFQVERRLPLKRASLSWIDGTWRYDPGPGYSAELPAAFHAMAAAMRGLLEDLRSGRVSASAVRERPEMLLENLRERLMPGIGLLSKAAASGG
jgi:hypothetical protein